MSIFRRKRSAQDEGLAEGSVGDDVAPDDTTSVEPAPEEPDETAAEQAASADARAHGPWDVSEDTGEHERLDLGAMRIRGVDGMQLQLEIQGETQQVTAVNIILRDSAMQLQAFAAPRSGGLWREVRREIAMNVEQQGGTVEESPSPLGTLLRTRRPSQVDGRTVFAPATFVGVDGPRWFLRGVLSGRAAIDDAAAEPMFEVFRNVVVVRGGDPMPPRDLLPLHLPQAAEAPATDQDPAGVDDDGDGPSGSLDPFERGPEITEVR